MATNPAHRFALEKVAEKTAMQGGNRLLFDTLYMAAVEGKSWPDNRTFIKDEDEKRCTVTDVQTGFFITHLKESKRMIVGKTLAFEAAVDPRIGTQSQLKLY